MNYLLTGASGFIGNALAHRLAGQGHKVYALYRNEAKRGLLQHENIVPVKGDIDDLGALSGLPERLDGIFHLAAFVSVWPPDPQRYFRLNTSIIPDLLEIGKRYSVRRIVFTSSAGVLGPSLSGEVLDEDSCRVTSFFNDYESSKFVAEERFLSLDSGGIERVILQPTRVYGPGLMSESNAVTRMILQHARGKWRLIPGDGSKVGNYVYIDAVLDAHVAAMERPDIRNRYVIGGENLSFNEFFQILSSIHGRSYYMLRLPLGVLLFAAHLMQFLGRLNLIRPRLTPPWVRKYLHDHRLSPARAERDLGMPLISFREGAYRTLLWAGIIHKSINEEGSGS
jgi:NAD+-dependent farnesol dehydrogenase